MKIEYIEYVAKGIIRAAGQAFCMNILLPLWYVSIKFFDILKGSK